MCKLCLVEIVILWVPVIITGYILFKATSEHS